LARHRNASNNEFGGAMTDSTAELRSERRYFTSSAILATLLAIAGFTPHYFMPSASPEMFAPLTPFLVFHASLMASWMAIFLVQSLLISAGRLAWHKKLGFAAMVVSILMVPTGCIATLIPAERAIIRHTPEMLQRLNVVALETTQMLLFGGMVATAIMRRNRTAVHKRLMLLATLSILPNAIVRLALIGVLPLDYNWEFLGLWAFMILCFVAADSLRIGRLHPTFAVGTPVAIGALILAQIVGTSAPWVQFWVQSVG
jgi:uncharacterized membrane protein YozB (DUF420 family)